MKNEYLEKLKRREIVLLDAIENVIDKDEYDACMTDLESVQELIKDIENK